MKFCPGTVPQWPTMVCFRSEAASGRFSRGLSNRYSWQAER